MTPEQEQQAATAYRKLKGACQELCGDNHIPWPAVLWALKELVREKT